MTYEEYQYGAWRECSIGAPLRASGGLYGGGTENIVLEVYAIEGNGSRASHNGPGYSDSDKSYTLNTVEHHAVAQVSNGGGYNGG